MKQRKNILLIDQTHALVDACTSILNGCSEVVAAERNAMTQPPPITNFDLVVLSVPPSSRDTLAALRKVKYHFPDVPLILASTISSPNHIVTALHSGAVALVRLPADPVELLAAICSQIYPTGENIVPKFVFHVSSGLEQAVVTAGIAANPMTLRRSFFMKMRRRLAGVRAIHRWPCGIRMGEHVRNVCSDGVHPLEGSFLGHFHVRVGGKNVERWRSRKGKSLFAYLLYHHKQPVCRDVLMETFWPNVDPECSRDSLNVAIHHIRQDLRAMDAGAEYVLFTDDCYSINPDIKVMLDCEDFEFRWHKIQRGRHDSTGADSVEELKAAVGLYGGDFMEDEPYEDWAASERENYREEYFMMLEHMSELQLARGEVEAAAHLCERILGKDSCRENVHKLLMLCYYRLGYRDKALRQYRKCLDALQKELDVRPTSATMRLFEDIRQGGNLSGIVKT